MERQAIVRVPFLHCSERQPARMSGTADGGYHHYGNTRLNLQCGSLKFGVDGERGRGVGVTKLAIGDRQGVLRQCNMLTSHSHQEPACFHLSKNSLMMFTDVL